ncbi:MAG: hypothetical protein R2784_06170 [Saprospiraceae bacterium]
MESLKTFLKEAGMTDVIYAIGSNFGDLNFDGSHDFYLSTGSPSFDNIFQIRCI